MYNFYRAWFGSEQACPRLETLSPPDTLIRVGNDGEHQFVAHRGILAAHSGYLKALLTTNSGSSSSSDRNAVITSVSVSSIGGEAFAPLLNYMYTGHLEVTLDNIYSVLLATHLLHMPGALEQCRAALLRLRAPPAIPVQQTGTGNVLRPVPNRLMGPPLCWPQTSLYSSPGPILPQLPSLHLPPTIISPILQDAPGSSVPYSIRERSVSPKSSTSRPLRSRSRSQTPIISQVQSSSHFRMEGESQNEHKISRAPLLLTRSPTNSDSSEKISVTDVGQSFRHQRFRRSRSNTDRGNESGGSVIYDVACCDGPVRFHRVLNENYAAPSSGTLISPRSCVENEDNTSGENDENGRPENVAHPSGVDCGISGSYTCGYCQHTFKSQYCYRKHARRHLLPTEAESSRNNQRQQDKRRREVRLLDLNVQYYPCKICGSKFPSYYFVHKHRKLCHSNSEEGSSESLSQEEINEVNQVNELNEVNEVNEVGGDSEDKQQLV